MLQIETAQVLFPLIKEVQAFKAEVVLALESIGQSCSRSVK